MKLRNIIEFIASKRTGKNLYDKSKSLNKTLTTTAPIALGDSTTRILNIISVLPGASVTFSNSKGYSLYIYEANDGPNTIMGSGWVSSPYTRTLNAATTKLYCLIKKSNDATIILSELDDANVQLEYGSTATAYEPYIS